MRPVFLKKKPSFSTTLLTVSKTPDGTGSGRTSRQGFPVPWLEAALFKVRLAKVPNPPGALKITSIQRTASWERDLLSKSRPLQKLKNFSKASRLNSSASVSERSSSPAGSRPWVSVDQERAKELSLPPSFLTTSSSADPCPSPCRCRLRLERTGLLSGSPEILRFWIVLLRRLLFPLRPERSPFEGRECLLSSSSTSFGVASRAPDGPRRPVPSRSWLPEGRRETAGTAASEPWFRLLRLLSTRLSSTNWPESG